MRKLASPWLQICNIECAILGLFLLYTALRMVFHPLIQVPICLGLSLLLCYTLYPFNKKTGRGKPSIADIILMILVITCIVFVLVNSSRYLSPANVGEYTSIDVVIALILYLLILEASRRSTGLIGPILAIILIGYAVLGKFIPGAWGHIGFQFDYIMYYFVSSDQGYWGMVPNIVASQVGLFFIFGSVLFITSAGEFFIRIASFVGGRIPGGAAQVAIIGSALFGTISGSATANVSTVGVITIPMMKKAGFKSHFAAAVEAVASTGGQIMPPVMGAGAFLMAQFLGMPYIKIAVAAVIPALLYYWCAATAINFEAWKTNLGRLPSESVPKINEVFEPKIFLSAVIPVGILLFLLSQMFTPQFSAAWSMIAGMIIYLAAGKMGIKHLRKKIIEICRAFVTGVPTIAWLLALITAIQTAVTLINMTGIGVKMSQYIFQVGQHNLLLALILTMITCTILGMGMTTTAAYVIAIAVVGPGLIKLGISPLAAHMLVFYFALLSCITPPVAVAVYPAAALAQADWWKTGWVAWRLGLSTFIVPFFFVYSPALLMIGQWYDITITAISGLIAMACLSAATMGYLIKPTNVIERIILIAACLLMVNPGIYSDLTGLGLLALVLLRQKYLINTPLLRIISNKLGRK